MIPGQFDYVRPGNLGETLQILTDREGEAKLLSGGYSLIPLMKLRLAQPALLVDLARRRRASTASSRPTTTCASAPAPPIARSTRATIFRDRYPLIHDVTAAIGDPQVRNWGTIGGSVAHADPASDWPAVLLATNATIVCRSQTGERIIAARDFFLDTFQTAIEPTEVLTEIRISVAAPGGRRRLREARAQGRRLRHGRASPRSCGSDADGTDRARRHRPDRRRRDARSRRRDAEAVLARQRPVRRRCSAQAGAAAAAQSRPVADVRGPVDYKRAMAAELTLRALRTAVERALAYA